MFAPLSLLALLELSELVLVLLSRSEGFDQRANGPLLIQDPIAVLLLARTQPRRAYLPFSTFKMVVDERRTAAIGRATALLCLAIGASRGTQGGAAAEEGASDPCDVTHGRHPGLHLTTAFPSWPTLIPLKQDPYITVRV